MPDFTDTQVLFFGKASGADQPLASGLRVTVTSGPDAGLALTVEGRRLIVGRGESAEVRLTDPTVSQFHVELELTADGIVVTDLNSKNGVHIGVVRVGRGTIPPGSALSIGASTLVIDLTSSEAPRLQARMSFGGLIGTSAAMRELYMILGRLAGSDLSVVIQGETGTGKEAAARVLQAKSPRAAGPFVVLDCTAIPAQLAPSLLFGHERGAFTGATERRPGVFESANDGVLFIDEIGELPLELQPLLLRTLESREVVPVGSMRPRKVNVRVISATWRDLRAMVNRGTFREDLYYRLAQTTVYMPPLKDRSEDIPLLVEYFLASLPPKVRAARTISAEAMAALVGRTFPGNVRELRNTVERMAMLAEGETVTASDLAFERILAAARTRVGPAAAAPIATGEEISSPEIQPFKEAKRTIIDEFERTYLQRLIERSSRNLTRAAFLAGLERHNLRELLKKHSLYESKE